MSDEDPAVESHRREITRRDESGGMGLREFFGETPLRLNALYLAIGAMCIGAAVGAIWQSAIIVSHTASTWDAVAPWLGAALLAGVVGCVFWGILAFSSVYQLEEVGDE